MKLILGILIGLGVSVVASKPNEKWDIKKIIAYRAWEAGQMTAYCEVISPYQLNDEQKYFCKNFKTFDEWWTWALLGLNNAEREK